MAKWRLRKCEKCRQYTLLKDSCPVCGGKTHIPHPAKFSLDDKYLKYRIKDKIRTANGATVRSNK